MSSAVTNWTSISAARSSLCQDPSVPFHIFVMSAISTTPFGLCKGKDTVKTFSGPNTCPGASHRYGFVLSSLTQVLHFKSKFPNTSGNLDTLILHHQDLPSDTVHHG